MFLIKVRSVFKKIKLPIFFVCLFAVGLIFRSQVLVATFGKNIIVSGMAPDKSAALVFGAGLKKDGKPTDALQDRITTGVKLYKSGSIKKLVMTGDNGSRYYDEVDAMKKAAVAAGVPAKDIVLDYAGFRTYDSCYRARDIFQLDDIIVVSQNFHLPRIVYICLSLGVKVTPVSADMHAYRDIAVWQVREFFANFKAWYQVEITHPKPKFLGQIEKVFD